MEWCTLFFQTWKGIIYETDSLFIEPKVGTIPFHSSHEKPSCSKIKLTLFHPPDGKPGKKR